MVDERKRESAVPWPDDFDRGSPQYYLPTPIVCAGIGFIAALALPGGFDGGDGFLIGLLVGLLLSVLIAAAGSRFPVGKRPQTLKHG